MKKSILYTGTGDAGETSLVGGKRVSKHDIRLEAYGTVDELNAHLGLLVAMLPDGMDDDAVQIRFIQHRLFAVGAYLATDTADTALRSEAHIRPENIAQIEQRIDTLDAALPPLRNFVLPGGSRAAAQAHVCRTVCRRAERCICTLCDRQPVDRLILRYINRLSDYLFVLSRQCNVVEKKAEIYWDKDCK